MSFQFKQFAVNDTRSAMKVSTDGVLVGAWAPIPPAVRTILDVGAGSGLVSLMMAQRCQQAAITAVEIDAGAAEDCAENFAASPWSSRLSLVCKDVMDFAPEAEFDMIVSNPPFFSEDVKAPNQRRAVARHGETLSPLSLIELADSLLAADGLLAMITDVRNEAEIRFSAELHHLNVLEMTYMATRVGKPDKRILWLIGRRPGQCRKSQLFLRDADANWHPDYVKLVEPFYLRMPKP